MAEKAGEMFVELSADDKKLKKQVSGVMGDLKKVAVTIGALFAGRAVFNFAKGAVEAFALQEKAETDLANALKATNQESVELLNSLKDLASEIQGLTGIGDEEILMLEKLAVGYGIAGKEIETFTKGAIGLSKRLDVGLREVMKKLAEVTNGEVNAMQELIPELRSVNTETEKLAIINRVLNESWQQLIAAQDQTAVRLVKLKVLWGDIKEVIGEVIALGLTGLEIDLEKILIATKEWIEQNKEVAKSLTFPIELLKLAFESLRGIALLVSVIVGLFMDADDFVKALGVSLGNISKIIKAMGATILLFMATIIEAFRTLFVKTIPNGIQIALLSFKALFVAVFESVKALGENFIIAMKNAKAAITRGKKEEFVNIIPRFPEKDIQKIKDLTKDAFTPPEDTFTFFRRELGNVIGENIDSLIDSFDKAKKEGKSFDDIIKEIDERMKKGIGEKLELKVDEKKLDEQLKGKTLKVSFGAVTDIFKQLTGVKADKTVEQQQLSVQQQQLLEQRKTNAMLGRAKPLVGR
jgi:hypothetical protein